MMMEGPPPLVKVKEKKGKRKEAQKGEEAAEFVGELEGDVPAPPTLQDFLIEEGEEESEEQGIKNKEEDTKDNDNGDGPPPLLTSTSDTSSTHPAETSSEEVMMVYVLPGREEDEGEEVVSSGNSLDTCEDALVAEQAVEETPLAPRFEEGAKMYPSLTLDLESPTSLPSWENIPTPVKNRGERERQSSSSAMLSLSVIDIPPPTLETPTSNIHHLYTNMILESSEEKVKEFLKGCKTSLEGFELYELLCNYQRAWNQLTGCERTLEDLRDKCTDLERNLWSVENETLTKVSTCVDGNSVSATHKFMVAKFDKKIYTELDRVLKSTKELVKDSYSLFAYSVELCRTQINHFFYKSFKDMGNLQSFEVQGYYSGYPTLEMQERAGILKTCISTLFLFLRRGGGTHPRVRKDCEKWVKDCVGLLLRIATLDDHLFILNHVIRCPPGMVGKNLSCLVQVPKIPIPSNPEDYVTSGGLSNLNLDYALTVLKIVLNPVPERDQFLKQAEIGGKSLSLSDPSSNPNQWVVVDSEGEDDPEDISFFKESDVISLLQQIPFEDLFRRVLLITKGPGGPEEDDIYLQGQGQGEVQLHSERNILKLMAFGTRLIEVLGQGFVSYYTDRYRQLVKMIGRLILHCVQYVTDHIEINTDSSSSTLIRSEYDLFFKHAVGILFSGKNIGTLQFLASMPFYLVKSGMLWHVYSGITKWDRGGQSGGGSSSGGLDISSEFENELVSMNESDAFYLLTTLCNMAIAREKTDTGFTRVVTIHLFQIGFLSPLTRDCCSKTARDLLGNLTRKYPEIISVLLNSINSKMQVIETFSLYLLKELAFDLWIPTDHDRKLLFQWLVKFPLGTIENQTARFVIQSMNWNFDTDGKLFLPFEIHYEVALMIMESNLKWENHKGFISEGMKQISTLSNLKGDNWAWDMMRRLHLHAFDRRGNLWDVPLPKILQSMVTFDSNSELECVRKGVEYRNPLASLMALYLTPIGHSVPVICSKGVDMLEILVQNGRFEGVIHALFWITPLFVDSAETLHSIDKFRNILTSLLAADMTYMRMAKNLITSDFPGEITKLFGDMIATQIAQCDRFQTDERSLISLWTESLTKLNGWNKDSNVIYLLDVLAKGCLTREDCNAYFTSYFVEMYKNMPQSNNSGISSLFSWNSHATTLLTNPSYSQTPYFIYYLLTIEMGLENETGFWKNLCLRLQDPKLTLDGGVKKACGKSKFATSPNFLTIYRWAQFGLELGPDHELGFLVWQKFFLRYFHRVSCGEGKNMTQYGCVAGRFFEGMINSTFFNKIKRKLSEGLSYFKERLNVFEQELQTSPGGMENASENPLVLKELLVDKISLASALVLWIEDGQLLQPTLYLPALAPQFLPTVLLSLMDGEEIPWTNYVDYDVISGEEKLGTRAYMTSISRNCWFEAHKLYPRRFSMMRMISQSQGGNTTNGVEEVLKRLNSSYDEPKEPPGVPVFEEVVPQSDLTMLVDLKGMKQGLDPHFKQLRDFSKGFALQISQIMALNCAYWESLPDLYLNSPAEMVVHARCGGKAGGTRSWETCSGSAQIVFKYTEAKLNENLGHQIHQNRTDYQIILDEKGTKPPPPELCTSAVYIEDFVTNLILNYRRTSGFPKGEERVKIAAVGSELFYHAATLVCEDTDFYPPTRQLLSSLLEVLGREFISTLPNQSYRLVTTAVKNPKLVGSFAPHLNLASCQPQMLLDIYREVSSMPRRVVDLAFVILTKFDISQWLREIRPRVGERGQLIQLIWKAILGDGFNPEGERLMVYDIYRSHLRQILTFDFPQHYGEILNLLLEGMEGNKVSPQIWYDFCSALSKDRTGIKGKKGTRVFATENSVLGYQEVMDTAVLLARHFTGMRLGNGLYGLYPKYRSYIEPISCFLQMIAYSVVAYSLKMSKGTLSQNVVDAVWPVIKDLYAPWMVPYTQKFIQQNCPQNWIQHMNFDASNVLQPWIASDAEYAMVIVNDFTDCLMFLVETVPGNSTIFSYLWNFYVDNFAVIGVKEHVVGVLHNCLVSVPWAMYWPTFTDVELMCKVVEKFLPASHSFLSIVFAQISWIQWIQNLHPKFLGKGHAMLLNLTVRLGNDQVARESPTWIQVMDTAEHKMNWFAIPPNALEPILNWLVMSIDPRVVLTNLDLTHRMDKALLRLLETACGYRHPETLSSNTSCNSLEMNTKRYCFVRSYVRLIISASSKHKNLLESQPKAFEEAIRRMINELAVSVKRENQSTDFFISHLREILSLMGNHSLGTIARNAVLEWCTSMRENHSLTFLMAMIQISCGVSVKPYIVCPLVETVIGLCFQYPAASWTSIRELTTVNPDELSNFYDIASKDGHYLVLYSLLLRRSSNLKEGGVSTFYFFIDLLKNLKPKESNEESIPLIYDVILQIVLEVHREASAHGAVNETVIHQGKKFLLGFAQHLSSVGDDKGGWLLGALGIGKSSQLSIKGKLFAKCLGTYVFAQVPIGCGVRLEGTDAGHFQSLLLETENTSSSTIKPHPEVHSGLEKLEALKQSRQHTDLIECIDFAKVFISDPNNALSSSSLFIEKLNGFLFSSRCLMRS